MYYVEQGQELDTRHIASILKKFQTGELPHLQRLHNYYKGKQDILTKRYEDASKPCNRIVTNYCLNITNNYSGYMTGQPITYSSKTEDLDELQRILDYNDVESVDSQFLRDALVYGVAYNICYLDEDGQQRFRTLDPRDCIPVYYNDLDEELAEVIRFYRYTDEADDKDKYIIEVYSQDYKRIYTASVDFSTTGLISEEPNYYGMCPISVFWLNDDHVGIFEPIISLQDAYNALLSSEIDDFEAFVDAYLVLTGMDADEETLRLMRKNRALLIPEGGAASYLTKSVSDTQIENMLSNINDKIHTISNSPDFTDEAFGTSSGVALRYKLLGFENAAGQIEKNMKKALQRRLELICQILHLSGGELAWRDIEITFTRNLPVDVAEIANVVNTLRGLVSDATLLAQIPFVTNVDEELEAIEEQNAAQLELYSQSFNDQKEAQFN